MRAGRRNPGRNARVAILECRDEYGVAGWMPGNPRGPATGGGTSDGIRRVNEFGRVLRERNILTRDSYTRWNGDTWEPTYGDTPNFGIGGLGGQPPYDMGDPAFLRI